MAPPPSGTEVVAPKGTPVTGVREKTRDAKRALYGHVIARLQAECPWLEGYEILPPQRRWHARHKATGTVVGPARHIMALEEAVRRHYQTQPLRLAQAIVDADPEFGHLEYAYAGLYELIPVPEGYLAVRCDGKALLAPTAEKLRGMIVADLAGGRLRAAS